MYYTVFATFFLLGNFIASSFSFLHHEYLSMMLIDNFIPWKYTGQISRSNLLQIRPFKYCTGLKRLKLEASWCYNFLGAASSQTSLQLSACLTKEQNLEMACVFASDPDPDPKIKKTCYFMTENMLVGSTNISSTPDNTSKIVPMSP